LRGLRNHTETAGVGTSPARAVHAVEVGDRVLVCMRESTAFDAHDV